MTQNIIPRWARIAAPIALIWYGFGLVQAVLGYQADPAAAPILIWVAYAAACLAGLAGAVALFTGLGWARAAFGLSLLAAVIYFGWVYMFGTPTGEDYGVGAMVIGVTAVLYWASGRRA